MDDGDAEVRKVGASYPQVPFDICSEVGPTRACGEAHMTVIQMHTMRHDAVRLDNP